MSKKLTYPLAYCLELDCILPPDNARDAHSSFMNPDKKKDFNFFCHDENCGCKMKGNRIHRWEINSGRSYYSLWPNELHSEQCQYKHLNSKKISTGGGAGITPHDFEDCYPEWLLTNPNKDQISYQFDFSQILPPLEILLDKIRAANNKNIDWKNLPVSDLRIIVESYIAMNTNEERRKHFLKIDDEDIKLRYTNKFSAFKWLPRADGKYSHLYFGKIRNKKVKLELINKVEYYSFFLDWEQDGNSYQSYGFQILVDKNALSDTYLFDLFEDNITNDNKWQEAYLYALDPKFTITGKHITIAINNPRHFVVRVDSQASQDRKA